MRIPLSHSDFANGAVKKTAKQLVKYWPGKASLSFQQAQEVLVGMFGYNSFHEAKKLACASEQLEFPPATLSGDIQKSLGWQAYKRNGISLIQAQRLATHLGFLKFDFYKKTFEYQLLKSRRESKRGKTATTLIVDEAGYYFGGHVERRLKVLESVKQRYSAVLFSDKTFFSFSELESMIENLPPEALAEFGVGKLENNTESPALTEYIKSTLVSQSIINIRDQFKEQTYNFLYSFPHISGHLNFYDLVSSEGKAMGQVVGYSRDLIYGKYYQNDSELLLDDLTKLVMGEMPDFADCDKCNLPDGEYTTYRQLYPGQGRHSFGEVKIFLKVVNGSAHIITHLGGDICTEPFVFDPSQEGLPFGVNVEHLLLKESPSRYVVHGDIIDAQKAKHARLINEIDASYNNGRGINHLSELQRLLSEHNVTPAALSGWIEDQCKSNFEREQEKYSYADDLIDYNSLDVSAIQPQTYDEDEFEDEREEYDADFAVKDKLNAIDMELSAPFLAQFSYTARMNSYSALSNWQGMSMDSQIKMLSLDLIIALYSYLEGNALFLKIRNDKASFIAYYKFINNPVKNMAVFIRMRETEESLLNYCGSLGRFIDELKQFKVIKLANEQHIDGFDKKAFVVKNMSSDVIFGDAEAPDSGFASMFAMARSLGVNTILSEQTADKIASTAEISDSSDTDLVSLGQGIIENIHQQMRHARKTGGEPQPDKDLNDDR